MILQICWKLYFLKIVDKFTMKCGTPINEQEFD